MSGGSLDYLYSTVADAAASIRERCHASPAHVAFSRHLSRVASALHDIEWVLSGDYAEGDDLEAISKVVTRTETLAAATEAAVRARDTLQALLSDGALGRQDETSAKPPG